MRLPAQSSHLPERMSFLRAPWPVTEGFYTVPGDCCRCACHRRGEELAHTRSRGEDDLSAQGRVSFQVPRIAPPSHDVRSSRFALF